MTNEDEPDNEKNDMRAMWIATAVIVLFLLGGMGINMLIHHDTNTGPTDISSQSRTAPAK
jgi:hypothetical protein